MKQKATILSPTTFKTLILIVAFGLFFSCKGNRMKNNEKALSQQILTEEQQLAREAELREKREKQLADSLAKLPKGFRFKEDRRVDPKNPPVTIDFTNEIPVKKFNLSEVGKEIKYIRLSVPGDSLYFSPQMGGSVSFTTKNIILNNNFGVHSFSPEGEYIEPIAKSNITNRLLNRQFVFGYFDKESYKGVWANHVSVAGNRIFYKATDYPGKKVSLFHYELKTEKQLRLPVIAENKNDGSLFKGEQSATGKEGIYSGTPGLASTEILGVSSNFYTGVNSHLTATEDGCMMAVFNLNGDTLCKFKQFDKLEHPITSSIIRSIESIVSWKHKGVFSFMKNFNDTVFRLIPPNRIVPVYVFHLGQAKISDEMWFDVHSNLDGKIRVTSILENEKFLLITCNYYIEEKIVERRFVFDKSTNRLFRMAELPPQKCRIKPQGGLPYPPQYTRSYAAFGNDIDEGLPFWPDIVTPQGEFVMSLRIEKLKDYFVDKKSEKITGTLASLQKIAERPGSDTNELILMIIKK